LETSLIIVAFEKVKTHSPHKAVVVVVVISQFYVPPASLRGYYGVDIPAFHGGGRPQVPLRAIFRLERAPG
jgi:hypothetical protein